MLQRGWCHAIACDPGTSTGIVLADWPMPVDWSTAVWSGATVSEDGLRDWLAERGTRFVRECAARHESCTVLIERPPQRAREPGGAAWVIRGWVGDVGGCVTVYQIAPGEWKPWVKANQLPAVLGKTRTRHERDALSLLWYWLETKRGLP